MGTLVTIIKGMGTARLAVMGVMIAAMAFFFIFMITRLTGSNMDLLYADLDPSDQNAITAQLTSRNIPFEIDGNRLLVPATQVGSLRMAMAAEGLPLGGVGGYEIFDNASSLGTTNFMQNVQLVRALEGELAKTIRSIEVVKSARVHLVMSRRQLFTRDKQSATASVILKMRGAATLTGEQIAAIQHLVAAAIPELDPSRVSIVDNKGKLLATGNEKDSEVARANDMVSRRINFERRMADELTELLEKSVGLGNTKVNVNADLDFDRISTTEEKFDPDGQVVRSTNTIEETSSGQESEAEQPVGVQQNLPDAQAGGGGAKSTNTESRTEEVTNFEISKKITNHVRESGLLKRISVAVLIDGELIEQEDGEVVYRERTEQEMDNLAKLVSSAIGYNAERGDTVEVINMRFVEKEVDLEEPLDLFFGLQKQDLVRIAEVIVLLILAVLAILLVVRPLLTRAFEALPAAAAEAEQRLLAEAAGVPAIQGPEGGEEEDYEELIDIDRVEGRVKSSSVKRVGEIVEKHPEEALSIIRGWMYQEA
ncbi:MAG: Flagellar M-ring protein [Alphaproteobacteria bacterium MarineAlpha3_Bin6]|nr:MAG: Flagellar M-ring protein [Alphaproteobacteria bacterium MarineAlpha3_Bin6]